MGLRMVRDCIWVDAVSTIVQGRFELTLFNETHVDRYGTPIPVDPARQAKTLKAAQYLGPWCSRCGKRGKECKDQQSCLQRQICRKGVAALASLPDPPDAWLEAHNYGKRDRWSFRWNRWADRRKVAQEYAYLVSVGRVEVAS